LALAIACFSLSSFAQAQGLAVRFRNTVEADSALKAFVGRLVSLGSAKAIDDKAVAALFAPRVKAFTRGLDPFKPWISIEDISGNYLGGAANIMVEQGEIPEGGALPDYRPEALKIIVEQVTRGDPFGTLNELPGAICAPAAYKVDRKAALRFAGKYRLDAYSLRFFAQPMGLYQQQNIKGELLGMVPPYTLMMFDYDPVAKEPWALYEASTGIKGYLREEPPALGLAQHHVCFGKFKGKYRIVGLFGYGL
jgi:hypothetical protein